MIACFRSWDEWTIYPSDFLMRLQNVFLGLQAMEDALRKDDPPDIPDVRVRKSDKISHCVDHCLKAHLFLKTFLVGPHNSLLLKTGKKFLLYKEYLPYFSEFPRKGFVVVVGFVLFFVLFLFLFFCFLFCFVFYFVFFPFNSTPVTYKCWISNHLIVVSRSDTISVSQFV